MARQVRVFKFLLQKMSDRYSRPVISREVRERRKEKENLGTQEYPGDAERSQIVHNGTEIMPHDRTSIHVDGLI